MTQIENPILEFRNVTVNYTSSIQAVKGVSAAVKRNTITAIMGPSGCGKSTLLRAANLMHNLYPNIRIGGEILLEGQNILDLEPIEVRRKIGMVFQRPTPFPTMSIYDNVLAGYSLNGIHLGKAEKADIVEKNLRSVSLWDEVKDKLDQSAHALSGGQQQRLCIARTLAMHPDVVLFDEPCSALDPISTFSVEETIRDIAQTGICAIIVTHNMEQATRVSDRTAFFYVGDMVETGPTKQIFSAPKDQRLQDYLTGRFG